MAIMLHHNPACGTFSNLLGLPSLTDEWLPKTELGILPDPQRIAFTKQGGEQIMDAAKWRVSTGEAA